MTDVGIAAGWGDGWPIETANFVPPATSGAYKAAMRKLAAGVTVVTTSSAGRYDGVTATAVCSVSADPPQLLCCIHSNSMAHASIHAAGSYCLNVLSREQEDIARCFAGWDNKSREQRFGIGSWDTLISDAPALVGALANFDCIVAREIAAATHTIFIGRVIAVRTNILGQPLIYGDGRFAGIADDD